MKNLLNRYYTDKEPWFIRTSLLIREILSTFILEVKDFQHPIVSMFGLDLQTYQFIKRLNASSMLELAICLVKSDAITFTLNEKPLILFMKKNSTKMLDTPQPSFQDDQLSLFFSNHHIIRSLVILMADSLSIKNVNSTFINNLGIETKKLLSKADSNQLEILMNGLYHNGLIKFNLNAKKIQQITYIKMECQRREKIKDHLVINKATYSMMSYLFRNETLKSVNNRRRRFGVSTPRGRPKSASQQAYIEYICFWTSNQKLNELDRFLLVHSDLGFSFDVLWTLFQKAYSEGEFDTKIMKLLEKKC